MTHPIFAERKGLWRERGSWRDGGRGDGRLAILHPRRGHTGRREGLHGAGETVGVAVLEGARPAGVAEVGDCDGAWWSSRGHRVAGSVNVTKMQKRDW